MIYFLTVNYYSTNLIAKLIGSLPANKPTEYQIVIVNNSPEDSSIEQLKKEYVLIIDAPKNLGFGCACNLGIRWIYEQNYKAIIWLINPDASLLENSLESVISFFERHPKNSILGTIIYTPTGETWFAGGRFIPKIGAILTENLLLNTDEDYVICDWVSGCSLLLNLSNFSECPQFDSAYFLYYEDFDFCRRYSEQGHLIAVTKQFSVIHQPSSITNRNVFTKIKYSTYSYLLTQKKYTNNVILIIRIIRLFLYATILLFLKPKIAFGKFYGTLFFFKILIRAG